MPKLIVPARPRLLVPAQPRSVARFTGEFLFSLWDRDPLKDPRARCLRRDRAPFKNLVVNAGKNWAREFLFDSVTPTAIARMGWIAIGTGTNVPAVGNVALQTEIARVAVGTYVAGGTGVATVSATFGAGVGTGAITEAGLFNAAGAGAGTMWNRVTRAAFNKGALDVLVVALPITCA